MIPSLSPKRSDRGNSNADGKDSSGDFPCSVSSSFHQHQVPSSSPVHTNNANNSANNDKAKDNNNDSNKIKIVLEQFIKLLNLSIQTSTKFLSPALSSILQRTIPPLIVSLEQITPLRVQHWIHILYISYANTIDIFLNSPQGQIVTQNILSIVDQAVNLLTSVQSRQVIIDTMSCFIKSMNVLQSEEMKAFIKSIPILLIRVIDTMSSGEAKIFYHSIGNLSTSIIEFVNHEDITLLIAEVTARMVHALEIEHYHHMPLSKRRRLRNYKNSKNNHRKKVFVAGGKRMIMMMKRKAKHKQNKIHHDDEYYNYYYNNIMTDDQLYNATEAEKRMKRNRYLNRTYNQKRLLQDSINYYDQNDNSAAISFSHQDRQVEDAILSSLSNDNTTTYSENAWLTTLGRRDDDYNDNDGNNEDQEKIFDRGDNGDDNDTKQVGVRGRTLYDDDDNDVMSLPSKVILNPKKNQDDNVDAQYSIASSLNIDDLELHSNSEKNFLKERNDAEQEEEYDLVDVVDTSYLRSCLKMRKQNSIIHSKSDQCHQSHQMHDVSYHNSKMKGVKDQAATDEHDIEDLVNSFPPEGTDNNMKHFPVENTSKRTKNIALNISNDDTSIKDKIRNRKKCGRKYEPSYMKSKSKGQTKTNPTHDKEASVQHFYRALEDLTTIIRKQSLDNELQRNTIGSKGANKKWYPNAAAAVGVGNEYGQDTLRYLLGLKGSRRPKRFLSNIGVGTEHRLHDEEEEHYNQSPWGKILHMILGQFTLKRKIVIVMIVSVYAFISMTFFVFGCYGIYKWFIGNGGVDIAIKQSPHTSQPLNEYIIRIVQEIPKSAIMETVTKSIEDSVNAGNDNFAGNLASAIAEKDLHH